MLRLCRPLPAAALLFAAALLVHACDGDSPVRIAAPAATATITPSPATTAARPSATPSPTRAAARGLRLVVSEFRGAETWLVSISALDLADRRPLARIEHAQNYAPRVALAPRGDLAAYTVLPPGQRTPDTDGALWVIDLGRREPKQLAARIDARTTPVWAPDGSRVVIQRALSGDAGLTATLDEVKVADGRTQELVRAPAPTRLLPVGFAPDAVHFYYVRFERDGTYLHEVDTQTRAARPVARLADGAVRDARLDPTGTFVAYLALSGTPARYHAQVVDLRNSDVQALLSGVKRSEDVGVAWRPGRTPAPAVGLITDGGGATGRIVIDAKQGVPVAQRPDGFDVPVAWSPDGSRLALRAFSGASADDPGREQPVLLDLEGQRHPLTGTGTIDVVGWISDAP